MFDGLGCGKTRAILWGDSEMFRLIVLTLAAFVAVLQIFGDPARKPEVSRAAPEGLTLANFVGVSPEVEEVPLAVQPRISDAEAIEMALAASKLARDDRAANPPRRLGAQGVELAAAVEEATATQVEPEYWYVSGSKVNLRQGPGTGNAVVAQVTQGTEALVLDRRDGWMQIETRDGGTSGWIFGKFLNEQKPG